MTTCQQDIGALQAGPGIWWSESEVIPELSVLFVREGQGLQPTSVGVSRTFQVPVVQREPANVHGGAWVTLCPVLQAEAVVPMLLH